MMRQAWLYAVAAAALVVVLAGCEKGSGQGGGKAAETAVVTETEAPGTAATPAEGSASAEAEASETPVPSPSPSPSEKPAGGAGEEGKLPLPKIALAPVAESAEFESLAGIEHAPGADGTLYVLEQPGRIKAVKTAASSSDKPETFLDIGDRVYSEGSEQGLLGLAFHPKYQSNGYFYVNYTTKTHTVIARYKADPASGRANAASEKVLLTFEQPFSNHNGGQLAFGPDGYLYIGTGDGGSGGDPHGNGQNKDVLLGKILRVDVDKTEGERAYGIPADNPFADGSGRQEIYAYGLRNPWRFSFDGKTGRLWAADVGQNEIEEIDLIERGGNYGWNVKEGTACYKPQKGCDAKGMTDPVWEYRHDEGQSVTGGYVYRGGSLPGLVGWYVYADYVSGKIWALRLGEDGKPENKLLLESQTNVTSFGVDGKGELYLCSPDGIFKVTAA